MKIAVVILNWNGKQLLEQFVPSVLAYSQEADIYIADNASNDDSVRFVSEAFPSVKIIQNKKNGGYAKGYNDALQHIDADVFCLLNSDVEVTENWLKPVISTFINEPNTAIIQPKILDYNRKHYFEYAGAAGGFIDKFGYPYCRGRIFDTIEKDNNQYTDATIFWASGACLFIRASVYKLLNGFDEAFFAHMEEIDLCWRAFNSGYEAKFVSSSVVYHLGGATLSAGNPKKTYLNFRNSLYTLTKNADSNLFGLVFTRLSLDGLAGIRFLIKLQPLHTLAIIKSHMAYYSVLPKLLKQRQHKQTSKQYYQQISIVWTYFIKSKRQYDCL